MSQPDYKLIEWHTVVSHIKWLSIDKVESEGYNLLIHFSDSSKNKYISEINCRVYCLTHEENLFDLWKLKNSKYSNIGNTFEILPSTWIKEFSILRDNIKDFKHLVIVSDDVTIQIISEEYPTIKKTNCAQQRV
jgi:hypothetical protein